MKKHLTILVLSLFTALAQSSYAAELQPHTVGHDLWIGYAGAFIAKAKGYFEDAGLRVELKPFSNPGDTLPALAAGSLDVGLTTLQNLVLLNAKGKADLVAVYLLDSSNGADAIVAKPDIATVAGLKGKKVGATIGEVNHLLLLAALEKAGLRESDIKIMNLSADDAGAAFLSGHLDAAVTWEPWVTKARSDGGKIIFSSAEIPDTILDCIAIPRSAVESKAEVISALITAIDRGVQFLRDNPGEAHEIIAKELSATPEEVVGMLEGDKIYSLADNAKLLAPGGAGYASMQRVIDFALSQKLIPRPLDPKSQFDPTFVAP